MGGWEPIRAALRLLGMTGPIRGGVAAGVVVLSLVACGGVSAPGAGPNPSVPAGTHPVVLDQSDAGRSITVHRGDVLEVQLQDSYPVPGSSTRWQASTADSKVLRLTRSQHQQPTSIAHGHASYTADFAADATGTAKIKIVGHNTCEAMNPAFCKDTAIDAITVTVA